MLVGCVKDYDFNPYTTVLKQLLNDIHTQLIDVVLFVHNLPCNTEIKKWLPNERNEMVEVSFHMLFDDLTYRELLKYCFYRMLTEYVSFSEDPDILRTEIYTSRQQRKEDNESIGDAANYIHSNREDSSAEVQSIEDELEGDFC